MFPSVLQTTVARRSRAVLASAQALLTVEHDHTVDWEVDQEPPAAQHPHRERLAAAWRAQHRRRGGALSAREHTCLSPLPSRSDHRQAAPTMRAFPALPSAETRRVTHRP
jgi:hypothetical protein